MTILTLKSRAKVNLTLDVLEREPSGYHRIQTIFHEVEKPYDTLIFEEVPQSQVWLEIHAVGECRGQKIPTDETNTILKAAQLLKNEYGLKEKGMRIILEKRIPPESGLGGAASNAATTLKGLNRLWELGLSDNTLRALAAEIGMDAPFFITGGCAVGMHYGEQLEHLPTLDRFGYAIEILLTDIAVSTRDAYAALDRSSALGARNRDTGRLVEILKKYGPPTHDELTEIPQLLHNDFELISEIFPQMSPEAHLSGSGGARFRLVRSA